nr:hypothetical protein [Crinivirus sp.]
MVGSSEFKNRMMNEFLPILCFFREKFGGSNQKLLELIKPDLEAYAKEVRKSERAARPFNCGLSKHARRRRAEKILCCRKCGRHMFISLIHFDGPRLRLELQPKEGCNFPYCDMSARHFVLDMTVDFINYGISPKFASKYSAEEILEMRRYLNNRIFVTDI